MGLSSVELWQRIAASQLASPLLCRTWAADTAADLTASEAIDATRVGAQLVRQGKLTQFQIETLLGDTKLPLVRHGYRLLEPVDYTPYAAPNVRSIWHDWWAVAKTPTAPTLWMRWMEAADFKQPTLAHSNPALPRALQQSQVRHDHLQIVQPPEMAHGTLQLCVEPIQGRLLSGVGNGQPQSIETVVALMSDVAAALTPLHAAGLAHGRVTPDRICLRDSGGYLLLRDPLCSATMPLVTGHLASGKSPLVSGLLGAQLPAKLDSVHFMAPEFLLPAQIATPQSDLYSLGCVVWLWLTGRVPYTAKQPEQVLAAHAERPLDLAQLPKLPEPLTRCLYHCLAKNPAARFANASQLSQALQEAQRIIVLGPSAKPKAKPGEPKVEQKAEPKAQQKVEPKVEQPAAHKAKPKVVDSRPIAATVIDATLKSDATSTKPTATAATQLVVPVVPVTPSAEQRTTGVAQPTGKVDALPVVAEPESTAGETDWALAAAASSPTSSLAAPTDQPASVASSTLPAHSTSLTPSATDPVPGQPAKAQKRLAQPGKPPDRRSPVRKSKKSQGVNWLTPVIGGGALVALLLVIVVMSGGLGAPSSSSEKGTPASDVTAANQQQTKATPEQPTAVVAPLADKFDLVSDVPTALWAPPRLPEPMQLDLLPPGGQFFACVRPAKLMTGPDAKQLLTLLDADLDSLWKSIAETTGVPPEQIDQVVLAAYPTESGPPATAWRIKLKEGLSLSQLKSKWPATVDTKVKDQSLLVGGAKAFYIQQQPLADSQSVTEFSVGPTELMHDVAELQGAAASMSGQMEQLLQATDRVADVNLLINPVFFYAEGRAWLDNSPPRFRTLLEKWVTRDMRALMLSTSFGDPWYYELRLIGSTDREAVVNMQKFSEAKQLLPQTIESWLVNELPHPHWRAMANRFPNMLRAFEAQTRIGSENGQVILNGYLPPAAAPNLIYASWMALQPGSTVSSGSTAGNGNNPTPATAALTPEQILDRKITLSIDQTGIENVLQAIGENANEKLPAGTKPLRFELDGAGFQRSGITRNQQIKDFQISDQTVRQALIALSKKGNPIQPHDDLTTDDQKLIWVLIDGDNPDKAVVSLTSREAAVAASHKLPSEFVKN